MTVYMVKSIMRSHWHTNFFKTRDSSKTQSFITFSFSQSHIHSLIHSSISIVIGVHTYTFNSNQHKMRIIFTLKKFEHKQWWWSWKWSLTKSIETNESKSLKNFWFPLKVNEQQLNNSSLLVLVFSYTHSFHCRHYCSKMIEFIFSSIHRFPFPLIKCLMLKVTQKTI